MRKILLVVLLFACVSAFAQQQAEVSYSDDFQSYGSPRNPAGWVDTSVGNPKPAADGLYKTWPDPLQGNQGSNIVYGTKQSSGKPEGNNPRIGTFSTLTTKTFKSSGRFEYRGRFIRTSSDTRIGFTFLSSYPEKDAYYLIGLWTQPSTEKLTMQLFGFGAGTIAKDADSDFTPEVNKWYRFSIQVDDVANATNIRARFWLDGSEEPKTFSIDATDAASTRLKEGRIGIWSAVKGDAYVDDLAAKSPVDHTAPVITFFEGGVQLLPGTITPVDHDARVDVRAIDDLSGLASLVTTVDGQTYKPLDPIPAEGTHTIKAVAKDNVGNQSEAEVQVLVDKSAPLIAVTADGNPLTLPFSTFKKFPVIKVAATDTWTKVEKLTATMDGKTDLTITEQGTHYLVVEAVDTVGNKSIVQATILADFTAPVIAFYESSVKLDSPVEFKSDPVIELRVNDVHSTVKFTAILDENKPWSSKDPIPGEGRHKIVVSAEDLAGNTATATLELLIDKGAPVVVLKEHDDVLDPAQTAKFNRDAAIEILVTDAVSTPTWSATLNGAPYTSKTPITAEQTHVLKVHAVDEADNVTDVTLTVLVDKSAPVINFYDHADNKLLDARELQKFRRDVAIDIKVADAVSSATYEATIDGTEYKSGTPIANENDHVIVVKAIDAAGNKAEATLNLLVDKTRPVIKFSEDGKPLDTAQQTPFNRPAKVDIDVTDNLSGVTWKAKLDGADYTSGAPIAADGTHVVSVHAVDRAENFTDGEVKILIDKAGPTIVFKESGNILDPGKRQDFNRLPSIEIVVSDALSTSSYVATIDGAEYKSSTPVQQGYHTIAVVATDALGNETRAKLDLLVDTTAPVVVLKEGDNVLPPSGAIFNRDILVKADVTDISKTTPAATLDGAPFSLTVPISAEGERKLEVTITDELKWSTTVKSAFTIDKTAPDIHVFEIAQGKIPLLHGSSFARDVVIIATADDITTVTFSAKIDGQTYTLGTPYTVDGSHKIVVEGVDAAGNKSTTPEILFHIDKSAPEVSIIDPAGLPFPSGKTFTGDVTINVKVVSATETTKVATIDGQPYELGTPYTLAGCKHTFKVVVTNLANLSTTVEAEFAIDRTPPSLKLFAKTDQEFAADMKFAADLTPSTQASDNCKLKKVVVLLDNQELAPGSVVSEEKVHTISATATDDGGLTTTVGPFTFVLDKTPPKVEVLVDGKPLEDKDQFNKAITPEIKADDLTITTFTLTLNGQPYARGTKIEEDAKYTLVVRVKDDLGNETVLEPIHFTIDKTAPLVQVVEGDEPFTGGKFKRSLTPVVRVQDLTETITNATVNDKPWTSGQEISSEGRYVLKVTVTDELGWVTVVPPIEFTIDKSAPVVAITEGGAPLVTDTIFNRDARPKIEATDTTNVTIDAKLDGATFASETVVASEAKHTLVVKATDELGFVTEVPPIVFTVDKTPPVVSVTEQGVAFTDNALLNHNAVPQVSVVDLTAFTIDARVDGQTYTLGTPIAAEGSHTFDAKVTDAAAWTTTIPTIHFVIDKTAPGVVVKVGEVPLKSGDEFKETIAPVVVVTDISATTITATLDGQPWTSGAPIAAEGEHVLNVSVTDAAKWTTTLPPITFIVDKSAPVVRVLEKGVVFATGTKFNRDVEPKIEITDLTKTTISATLDGAAWTPDTLITTESASHVLAITVTDHLGHATVVPPIAFTIDKTAPVVAVTESGQPLVTGSAFNRNVKPEIAISDITKTTTTALLNEQPYTFGTELTQEAKYSLTATVVDELAWSTTIPTIVFYIDRTAPVVTLVEGENPLVDGTWFNRDVAPRAIIKDTTDTTVTATLNNQPYELGTPVTAEGAYTLKVKVTDKVGLSTDVPPVTFTIDKTPPAIAFTYPIAGSTITTARVVVTGVADDAVSVEVNDVEATITPDKKFATPTAIELLEGENTLVALGIDKAGNNTTVAIPVTLDTRAPELSVTAPAANACIDATEIAVSGRATDASLTTVKVTMGTATVDATIAADRRSFTATIPAPAEGKFTIRIEAKDASGHAAVATVPVVVDRTKPIIEVTENGEPFTASAINRAIALGVRAVNETNATLTVTLDGQPYTPGTVIASESPAPHVLRAKAKDCAGHESDEKVVQFVVDRTPPLVTSINPANGATVGEKPSTLTGTLSEPAALVLEATGAAAQVSGVNFTLTAPLQEGANTFALVAQDAAGNSSRFVYNLTIRTTPPSVEIVENGLPIPANHVYRRAVTPIIRSDDAKATLTATLNGAAFTSGTEISSDGTYTITAKARDSFGHESATATATFKIDRSGPSIDITSPANNAVIKADTVEVRGTVGDVQTVTVNGIAATVANGTFTATVPLDPGPNTIIALATDAAGNSASDTVDVVRDTGRIGILLVSPADKLLTNRPTILVAGQVLTPTRSQSVTINGTQVPLDPAGLFRVNDFALVEGANTITASVTSTGGDANSISVTVTADFTAPLLKVLANGADLVDGARFATSPSITLDASDQNTTGLTTKLTIDGELVSPGVTTLLDGGHALTAIARDAAGNETRVDRVFFIGTAGSFGGCALSAFNPVEGSAVFTESVRITGRSGGAAGVLINGFAAAVADGSFCGDANLAPGRNEVEIRCADASGQPTNDPPAKLVLYRYVDPAVSITSPANGAAIATTSVTVTGTVGAGVVSGDVNGVLFTVPDDGAETHAFSVPNVNVGAGLNVITARAKTKSSRVDVATVRVTGVHAAPSISISSPLTGSDTGASSIDVSGTYADVDPATIVVKVGAAQHAVQTARQSDTTGTFTATVPLAAAQVNVIEAAGRNGANAAASSKIDVTHVASGPSIAIASPADNTYFASTQSTTLHVTGTFTGDAGSTVSVNGVAATLTGTSFAADVELTASSSGITQLIARVTAPDARSASDSVRVVRFPEALAVKESFPANDATSIDRGAALVVLFNHPLDRSTAASAFRVTDAANATVDGTLFVDRDAITFAPLSPLRSGTRYTANIATSLKDLAGASLAGAHTFAFTTGGSAPASAPIVDDTPLTGCFSGTTLTGRVSTPGAQVRVEVDGVKSFVTASETGAFKVTFTFSGQSGYHVVRVVEIGADGSLSAERALCFRINCSVPQVLAASLDRTAKTVSIQFNKPMDLATLTASPAGSIVITPEGETALTGTVALNAIGDTATITLTSVPAKNVALLVKKSVKDAAGAAMVADYTQTFTYSTDPTLERGKGYVSGAVYDATNGRPLTTARIDILGVATLSTNDRGRYSRPLSEGAYTIQASAPGYTTVWRQVVVPAGAGVVPIDIRLTKRGTALTHGADTKITKKVDLTTSSSDVHVTAVGGQSLAGLLPLGWSPLASAEVSGAAGSQPASIPGSKLTFTVDAAAITAAAQTLALVQYDSEADEWRVLVPVVNVASDGKVVADITTTGNYALVYADRPVLGGAPPPPAAPRAGAALTGVANPCVTTPDTCKLTGKSFVLDPKAVVPSGRTVATLTTDGAKPYPSGTAVQAFIDEQLNLADGRVLVDPPFATDLLIYRTLNGVDGIADFHLSPTLQAQSVILRDGVDHIRIVDYPGRIDRGTLLGAEGGRVPGDGNVLIDVPAGATSEPLHASVSSMSDSAIAAFGAIPGFRVAAGFTFSLTRANEPQATEGLEINAPALLTPAKATLNVPNATSSSQVIVAEVLSSTPFGVMFRLVALTSSTGANVFTTRAIVSTQLPLDGIVRDGRYLVLVADNPIAYAYGQVKTAGGTAVANARVTSGTLGVRDLTRLDGVFVVPVAAKPAAPFSLVARTLATGDGAPAVHSSSPDPDAFVNFGTLTLAAQAPRLTAISPANGAVREVTQPLIVEATFDTSIDASSVANGIRVTNLTTNATLAGSVSLGGANTVRFNATEALRASSQYSITVLPSIRSTSGTPFGQTAVSTFSTRATPANMQIRAELIHITLPDASGKVRIYGTAGALPTNAKALAVRRGNFFIEGYQTTVTSSDGSFSFVAGHSDARDRVTVTDIIDLQVLDPVSNAIVAIIRLTPFISEDGRSFLAPTDLTTKHTTPEGLTVTVPEGAFDVPTMVTLTASQKAAFNGVPKFDNDLEYATSLELKFDGVANKRLDVELPIPPGTDTTGRDYVLGYLGQSIRGPRVMIVDTIRIANGKFVTAEATSGANVVATKASVKPHAALTDSELKKYLLGVNRSGIFSVVDIKSPAGAQVAWGTMEGLQAGYDLFWDVLESLYAAHFYISESRGRIAIPIITGKQFQVVGVDAQTGLQAFAKVYDPIPDGDPGAAVVLANPNPDQQGPYPVHGTPFRVESYDMIVEDVPFMIRNFLVDFDGDKVKFTDANVELAKDLQVTVFNVSNGDVDRKREDGLQVNAKLGDRVLLLIEEKEVDPFTSLSIVFSEPISVGDNSSDDAIDAFLRARFRVEIAPEPAEGDDEIVYMPTEQAHFRVDSGSRRVLIDLPASLQRGMRYRVGIHPSVADGAGMKIGQFLVDDSPAGGLSEPLYLYFRVRAPGGLLSSFDLQSGAIRDQALNGNVLLMTAMDGGVVAYDVADPASLNASTAPIGVSPGSSNNEYWALASDHHGRIFATAITGDTGAVRSFRLEDFLPVEGSTGPRVASLKSGAMVCWRVGSTVGMNLASATILSDRVEALPRKMQLLLQDEDEELTLPFASDADPAEAKVFDKSFPMTANFPYLIQRITVENRTLDMRWSADAKKGGSAEIKGIVARKNDRLRVIRNLRTYTVISLFGYGAGVFDLNAIESNDVASPPAGYKPVLEKVRVTSAPLRPECGDPLETHAIPDLTFSPDATIITRPDSNDLYVFAVDQRRGVLDLKITPPTDGAAPANTCDERGDFGLVFRNTYFVGNEQIIYDHPRLKTFRDAFKLASGRFPTPRMTGASYYHWTLEAKDNKALPGSVPTGDAPPRGQRGSTAGSRVQRDYMLLPSNEYGLLVVEIGGTPPTLVPSYDPLQDAHLVDIIWIPAGAAAVRAIPRTNLATVVDGEGRILLIDLSRIDERFAANGDLLPPSALFKTVAAALGSEATYGVGADDPRIVWKSEKGVTTGTLAPVIDADTGFVYIGKILQKTTSVVAAIDPRVQMKVDLDDGNGLAEVGGVVPLGIDPPQDLVKGPNGSLAAFRFEVSLPGAMTQALSGNKLRAAIESERVFNATTEQMPAGFPRAHLRMKDRSGFPDPRADENFYFERVVPESMAPKLRHQKGFNKFISPWIVAVADPRASIDYTWPPPGSGSTLAQLQSGAGCYSCERPQHLKGKTEADRVWELYTNGRLISVRPDLCVGTASAPCSSNLFTGTRYDYLARENRFTARFSTIPADTVRPPQVLVAAQAPPVAAGALEETTYLHSGEVETANVDMDAGGRANWNVVIDRTYRSRTIGGSLGMGWESTLFRRLRALPNGDVEYRDGAGEIWRYVLNKNGQYDRPKGYFLKLARTDRGWLLIDQQSRTMAFDSMGRLVHETDEFVKNAYAFNEGNIIRYLYDLTGRLAQVVDPVGRVSRLAYNNEGRLQTIENWLGRVVYEYDADANLTTVTLPNTGTTTPKIQYGYGLTAATYNDKLELRSNLTTITDPIGGTPRVEFVYNATDRDKVQSQKWATGESATFSFASGTATVTDVLGQQRTYELTAQPSDYNSDRAHVSKFDELNVTTARTAFGTLPTALITTPDTEEVTRRLKYTFEPDGMIKSETLESVGGTNASTIRTTTNTWKKIEPAAPGFVLETTKTGDITRELKYDETPSSPRPAVLEKIVIGSEDVRLMSRPSAAKLEPKSSNDSIESALIVDKFGQPVSFNSTGGTDAGGNHSRSYKFFDAAAPEYARALPQSVKSSGLATTWTYEPAKVTVKDPRGIETVSELDGWRRPTKTSTSGASLTLNETYKYDANGRVEETTREQDGRTVRTSFVYDAMGRVKESTVHNAVAVGENTASSVTAKVTYDIANRKIVREFPGGSVVTEELDRLGRVTKRTTSTGGSPIEDRFVYDVAGNLVWSADTHVASATAYDVHGRTTASLAPNGNKTETTYDDWGNPKSIKSYDSAGSLIGETTAGFTPSGRMTSAKTKVDDAQSRDSEMRWDGAGRRTAMGVSGRASKVKFDDAGRLKSSESGAGSASSITTKFSEYTVSDYVGQLVKNGIFKEKGGSPFDLQYEYDTLANVTLSKAEGLEWRRKFDQDGNLTSEQPPAREATTFKSDARGNVTSKTEPGSAEVKFGYHAGGASDSYRDESDGGTGSGLTDTTESDLLGRPKARKYPDGKFEYFTYDGPRLKSMTDRQGRIFNYEYNTKGQLAEIRRNGGELIEKMEYDAAGRLAKWRTRDAELVFENFDMEGRPRRTAQTRFKDRSGFGANSVLDSYEQTHEWTVHGERKAWTMPSYTAFPNTAHWTQKVEETYDAAGNVIATTRRFFGATSTLVPTITGDYRNTGRPNVRTLTTYCGSAPSCTATTITRDYSYDTNGLLSELKITAAGLVVGGSSLTYDGTQISKEKLLGISGDTRSNHYTYDSRSRLATTVTAREDDSDSATEHLTQADFRTKLERTATDPGAPPSLEFAELPGHRIGSIKRGSEEPRTFEYTGAERTKDERYQYEFDDRGRIILATELPSPTLAVRRIHYYYSANDRLVGRRAEYATLSSPTTPPNESAWKLEDRANVIAADGLPADTTFVWDPISDRLVSVYKSGASANPSIDPNGGLLRQILHGSGGYDDPVEVAITDGATPDVNRLYPLFNEAGNGALQAILNVNGEVVSRTILEGAYGEDEFGLAGAAVDRMEITRHRDTGGNLTSVDVSIRLTDEVDGNTLPTGVRLAAVAGETVVRTSSVAPTLSNPNTITWNIPAAAWTTLTDPAGEVNAISIAVTNQLRAKAWGDSVGVLPPPDWASNPRYSSATLPVEYRASLAFLTTTLAGTEDTTAIYEAPSLSALGGPVTPASRFVMASAFQALPFAEPATGLVYARARWYDPNSGSFLSPDPMEYRDSSNLYAFAGCDPVNGRDPRGLGVATTADGSWYVTNPKDGNRYLLPIQWIRANQLAAQDVIRFVGGLSYGETKDWMYDHGFKFTHDYDRPVVEVDLPKGNNWWMNALIATSGLPPQNRQQQIVQGGLQIAGTATMIAGGTYGNRGRVSAQPVFETRVGVQVNVNDFMVQKERFRPTVTVYRVEGPANARVTIGPNGEVTISDGQGMLFLNFGDPIRAQEFFAKRLGQKMLGVSTKSFEVPRWFMLQLEQEAVPQELGKAFPGAVQKVDPAQAPNQYGLRPAQVEQLRGVIVPGSGKDR